MDQVPADVARLLRDCIDGYEHLEVLLLFVRARARTWAGNEVAAALNLPESVAVKTLEDLMRNGLLRTEQVKGGVVYAIQSNVVGVLETTERLAAQYDTNRIAIMKLMNANALARVRGDAVRAFADAFVVGGKKHDG